jgi:hypothetical protein
MKTSLSFYISGLMLSLGSIAAPTTGNAGTFSLPPNSLDGFYIHTIDESGNKGLEYLGLLNSTVKTHDRNENSFEKRASEGAICQGSYLYPSDVTNAEGGLEGVCGGGKKFSSAISYQGGDAVAYGCNYGSGQTCHSNDVATFFGRLTTKCGGNQQGWYSYPDWKVSYGVTHVGNSFC